MNIIITEAQLSNIILTEQNEYLLLEGIFNSKSIDEFKSKIKKALIGGVTLISVIAAIHKTNLDRKEKEMLENFARIEAEMQHKADSVFNIKVEACRKYMETALKNQGYSFDSTELKPETLVREAEKNNFDLPFLIAVVHHY